MSFIQGVAFSAAGMVMLSASEKKAVGPPKLTHDTRLTICSACGEIYDGASEIERRHHASVSHDPLLPQARFTAR